MFTLQKQKNSYYLIDGQSKIKTNHISKRGIPIFRIRYNLLEMIPELKLIIKEHMIKNNIKFKVSKYIDSKCWLSTNGQTSTGYGNIYITVIVNDYKFAITGDAHVASYLSLVGPNPTNLLVRHKCDVPPCCNPDHLELGTHKDNRIDACERNDYINPTNRGAFRLNVKIVCLLRYLYKYKLLGNALLAKVFDVTRGTIEKAVTYETYPTIDETWFYEMQQIRNRRWTTQQIDSMYESGLTAKHLSKILDVSHSTVLSLLAEKRGKTGEVAVYRFYTPEEDSKIIKAHEVWGGLKSLAKELDVTLDSLYQRVKKLKVKGFINPYIPPGK